MKFYLLILLLSFLQPILAQIQVEEVSNEFNIISFNDIFDGSGISFCDFNNDGLDDISINTDGDVPIKFYSNTGVGFLEVNILGASDAGFPTKQVIWVDIDNDGDKDLFIASESNSNQFFRNDDGIFVDILSSSGLPTTGIYTNSGNWGDFNNDGFLDVFLANRDLNQQISNMLFQNNGDNTFTDVTISSGIGEQSELTFMGAFLDFDNDGFQDIYLINDRLFTSNILYHNNGDGTFTDVSDVSQSNYNMNAMSVAIEDYNYDGFLDIYITNIYDEDPDVLTGNVLMHNNGDGTFSNLAEELGVRFDTFSWGANWIDGDNDGDLDLYVSGSPDFNSPLFYSSGYYQNENQGSSFFKIDGSGFETDLAHSYGNAIGDFNNDGFTDYVVSNRQEYNVNLWENTSSSFGNTNNWLKVNVEGTISNRDGIGARIEISINGEKQYRVVTCGESYLSQNSSTEMFGLGANDTVDYLRVTWPTSGLRDQITNIDANQTILMVEGENLLNNDLPTNNDIAIFPNPSKGVLNIDTYKYKMDQVIITDLQGRLIKKQDIILTNNYQLATNDLVNGVYILSITIENNTLTKRFIKE